MDTEHPIQETPNDARRSGSPRWVMPAVCGAIGLLIGFGSGWFGHQAYIVSVVESAIGDFGKQMDNPGEPVPEGGEGVPTKEVGPKAPTKEDPSDGVHTYSDPSLGEPVGTFEDESTGEVFKAKDGAEYVPVSVTLENDTKAETIPGYEAVYAYDTEGVQYTSAAATGDAGYGLSPGLTAQIDYHFEVPEGTELAWVTLQNEDAEMEGSTDIAALHLAS